jgi:hypothetical protein
VTILYHGSTLKAIKNSLFFKEIENFFKPKVCDEFALDDFQDKKGDDEDRQRCRKVRHPVHSAFAGKKKVVDRRFLHDCLFPVF